MLSYLIAMGKETSHQGSGSSQPNDPVHPSKMKNERDPNSEGLVLAEEVAAILRISRTEVYMLARRRILPCIRLSRKRIRFDLEDVREAIKKLRVSIRTVQ